MYNKKRTNANDFSSLFENFKLGDLVDRSQGVDEDEDVVKQN